MVYLGKDILGSVRTATGDGGTLEDRYEYDAFGKPYIGDLSGGMDLGYTGKPYDADTGMYNYGYRDYTPELARFTTVDPIRDGTNWFAYVNNDPVNWIDPWGLYVINDITLGGNAANDYQNTHSGKYDLGLGGSVVTQPTSTSSPQLGYPTGPITLPNDLNSSLATSNIYATDNNPNTQTTIIVTIRGEKDNYVISITVTNTLSSPKSGVVAYVNPGEVLNINGTFNEQKILAIVNNIVNYVNGTPNRSSNDNNITYCSR
jgi:RHS repeat-associated protein